MVTQLRLITPWPISQHYHPTDHSFLPSQSGNTFSRSVLIFVLVVPLHPCLWLSSASSWYLLLWHSFLLCKVWWGWQLHWSAGMFCRHVLIVELTQKCYWVIQLQSSIFFFFPKYWQISCLPLLCQHWRNLDSWDTFNMFTCHVSHLHSLIHFLFVLLMTMHNSRTFEFINKMQFQIPLHIICDQKGSERIKVLFYLTQNISKH